MIGPPKCLIRSCENPAAVEDGGPWAGTYTVCTWHAAYFRRQLTCAKCGARMIGEAWRYRHGLCWRCWTRTREARAMRWIAEKGKLTA